MKDPGDRFAVASLRQCCVKKAASVDETSASSASALRVTRRRRAFKLWTEMARLVFFRSLFFFCQKVVSFCFCVLIWKLKNLDGRCFTSAGQSWRSWSPRTSLPSAGPQVMSLSPDGGLNPGPCGEGACLSRVEDGGKNLFCNVQMETKCTVCYRVGTFQLSRTHAASDYCFRNFPFIKICYKTCMIKCGYMEDFLELTEIRYRR